MNELLAIIAVAAMAVISAGVIIYSNSECIGCKHAAECIQGRDCVKDRR